MQWILPICLVSVAIILPIVGYLWMRKVLSEDEDNASNSLSDEARTPQKRRRIDDASIETRSSNKFWNRTEYQTRQRQQQQQPQDLRDLPAGSTQSMETDDGIETIVIGAESSLSSTTVYDEDDMETASHKHHGKKISRGREDTCINYHKKDRRRHHDPSAPLTFTPRSIIRDPETPRLYDSNPKKVSFHKHNEQQANVNPTENRQQRKSRRRERRKRVDVHMCTSTMCEVCHGSNNNSNNQQQHQQQSSHSEQGVGGITFVSAQPLDPKMIHKLQNAPYHAKWYEMGQSFHDLYQKANGRNHQRESRHGGRSNNNNIM